MQRITSAVNQVRGLLWPGAQEGLSLRPREASSQAAFTGLFWTEDPAVPAAPAGLTGCIQRWLQGCRACVQGGGEGAASDPVIGSQPRSEQALQVTQRVSISKCSGMSLEVLKYRNGEMGLTF